MEGNKARITEVTWPEVRERVAAVNPELSEIIDEIDPSAQHTFYLASYPFGSKILENGKLHLPNGGEAAQASREAKILAKLNYSSVPVGLVLNRALEKFVEPDERMVPLRLFQPGDCIGLPETLQPENSVRSEQNCSISSGARSLFLLPKITDANAHSRLRRELNIQSSVPRNLAGHWKIFVEIANHARFSGNWHSEVLFFTDKWFENHKDPKWYRFKLFLLQEAWHKSLTLHNGEILGYVWEDFSLALNRKNIKPKPHLIDTFKHLVHIALGVTPGFRPTTDNEVAGPVKALQKIYVDIYGLRHYIPTMMQPYHLNGILDTTPIYYSLQSPTSLEDYPKLRHVTSIINDMRGLKNLTDSMQDSLHNQEQTVGAHQFLQNIQYDYFHSESDMLEEIRTSKDIAKEDPAFNKVAVSGDDDVQRVFSDNSPFVRGCIRLVRSKPSQPVKKAKQTEVKVAVAAES